MGLAEVLGAHELTHHGMHIDCGCGDWFATYETHPEGGWDDEHHAHVEAALLAHLADVLGSDETRAQVVKAIVLPLMLSMKFESDDVRTIDVKGAVDGALAAVREVLGLPGGGA